MAFCTDPGVRTALAVGAALTVGPLVAASPLADGAAAAITAHRPAVAPANPDPLNERIAVALGHTHHSSDQSASQRTAARAGAGSARSKPSAPAPHPSALPALPATATATGLTVTRRTTAKRTPSAKPPRHGGHIHRSVEAHDVCIDGQGKAERTIRHAVLSPRMKAQTRQGTNRAGGRWQAPASLRPSPDGKGETNHRTAPQPGRGADKAPGFKGDKAASVQTKKAITARAARTANNASLT